MPIKIGRRAFAPRPFTTLLTIALLAMLVSLGFWQLRRGAEKQVMYDSFASGNDTVRRIDGATAKLPRYQHLETEGHYDGSRQILIDNMFSAERAGYFVITPFALKRGGWILVNRGWVPFGQTRAERPSIPIDLGERQIRGRADNLPSPGIHMGHPAPLAPPYPVVANFPTHAQIAQLLGEAAWTSAADVVLLDADQPDGFARKWAPPGFPPIRHLGYAVQWFALALALAVIYVVTNFRRTAQIA